MTKMSKATYFHERDEIANTSGKYEDTQHMFGRSAIAYTDDLTAEYRADLQGLYAKFGIAVNDDGEPVKADGSLVVPANEERHRTPRICDLPKDATERPAGTMTIAELAERYNCPVHPCGGYLRKWRHKYGDPAGGYFRNVIMRKNGSEHVQSSAYYDPERFHAFLMDIQDKESGARRMLAGRGIGKYVETRGRRINEEGRISGYGETA